MATRFPGRSVRRAPVRRVRPSLGVLEDRLTPSTYTVTDAADTACTATDVSASRRYAVFPWRFSA
jgi:hypothetical protein